VVYLEGQALFTQGHEAAHGVIVQKGTANVEIDGSAVAKIFPGEFLGEFVVLGVTSTATATVRAIGTMVTFHIDRNAFKELLDEFPAEKKRLETLMKKRLETVEKQQQQHGRGGSKLIFNSQAVAKMLSLQAHHKKAKEAGEAIPEEPTTMRPTGMPVRRKMLGEWISQRKQQIMSGPAVKLQRMLDKGRVVERLPHDQGLRVTSEMRLLATAGLYGKKVWQEIFDQRPAPPAIVADADELGEALDELEDRDMHPGQYFEDAISEEIESDVASLPEEEDSEAEDDEEEEE